MLHYEGRPLTGEFGGGSGEGEGQVVFGDVEEFGGVFCAGFVGYGGPDAFVAGKGEVVSYGDGWVWEVVCCRGMDEAWWKGNRALTRPTDPVASSALLSLPEVA